MVRKLLFNPKKHFRHWCNMSEAKDLLDLFQGAMVGGVVGDVLGAPLEFITERNISMNRVQSEFQEYYHRSSDSLGYTDDTAMARQIAKSFVAKKHLDPVDLATRFVDEYYTQPDRGYGRGVLEVFAKLKKQNFTDVFVPAQEQFNGSGSYGNGGAMRVHPVALFGYHQGEEQIKKMAETCTKITHTHPEAVNGAVLQALAIFYALKQKNPEDFLKDLGQAIDSFGEGTVSEQSYRKSFEILQNCLAKKDDISAMKLGNDVSALKSVPSAIYSFLRIQADDGQFLNHVESTEEDNKFVKTLKLAYSFGGDTDTIGTMAGAIAGAYYGLKEIPKSLRDKCEGVPEALELGEQLYSTTLTNDK